MKSERLEANTILIPSYSVDDLPSDLSEESAGNLLNALVTAWHPLAILHADGIPAFHQADSHHLPFRSGLFFLPECSEDLLTGDWAEQLDPQQSRIIRGGPARSDWLAEIVTAFGDVIPEGDTAESRDELTDWFLALGLTAFQVAVLTRKLYHYIDPDQYFLSEQVHKAADAWLQHDREACRDALQRCFDCLHETREQFHPVDSVLADLIVPGDAFSAEDLKVLLAEGPAVEVPTPLNLLIEAGRLHSLCAGDAGLQQVVRSAAIDGQLCLLSGHETELRCSTGSMAAFRGDLQRGVNQLEETLGSSQTVTDHVVWARRRFGLLHNLPAVIRSCGLKFGFHAALDDGIYPEQERGQFLWQAPDGTTLPSTSRLPVAVDSAAGMLSLPARLAESIQADQAALMLLARLPAVRGPWLADLRTAASFAPVLGRFGSLAEFLAEVPERGTADRFEAGAYLSSGLIRTSVLKSEAPVSAPAALYRLRFRLDCLSLTEAACRLVRPSLALDTEHGSVRRLLDRLDRRGADGDTDADESEPGLPEAVRRIRQSERNVAAELLNRLQPNLQVRTESEEGNADSGAAKHLCVVNTLPWQRTELIDWPSDNPPAESSSVINCCTESATTGSGSRVQVRVPAGGFVCIPVSGETGVPAGSYEVPRGKPLAEDFLLRNQHFEVVVSEVTGGISSVRFHYSRSLRVSQQCAFRYEQPKRIKAEDGSVVHHEYTTARCIGSRIVQNTPLEGAIETLIELCDPDGDRPAAEIRQTVSLNRTDARLSVLIEVLRVSRRIVGNPWLTYLCSRFAWPGETAAITRSVLEQPAGFRGERFESPGYIEVADADERLLIVPHGRPWHRRSGPRMLDSLLLVEGEDQRRFRFTLAFDDVSPMRTAAEVLVPPLVLQADGEIPEDRRSTWLLGCSATNTLISAIEETSPDDSVILSAATATDPAEDRPVKLALRVLLTETDNRTSEAALHFVRPPRRAAVCCGRQIVRTLHTEGTCVKVPVAAGSVQLVEVVF